MNTNQTASKRPPLAVEDVERPYQGGDGRPFAEFLEELSSAPLVERKRNKKALESRFYDALGKRLRIARGARPMGDVAEHLAVHRNTIWNFERGEACPEVLQLIQLASYYDTTVAELLGQESMDAFGPRQHMEDENLVMVPAIGVSASTGPGSQVDAELEVGKFAFRRSWVQKRGLNAQALRVLTAKGDSMEPTIRDGDILLADSSVEHVKADGIYLIEQGGELRCKRLQSMIDGGVRIRSDNARYETEVVPPGQVELLRVVAKVVWIGGER
jgi:phage repressor protein C with HTH and peptisase S24 domain